MNLLDNPFSTIGLNCEVIVSVFVTLILHIYKNKKIYYHHGDTVFTKGITEEYHKSEGMVIYEN